MKKLCYAFALFFALFSAFAAEEKKIESLVLIHDQIDDFFTRRALAQIYSNHQKTWPKAILLYRLLLLEKPNDVGFYIEMGRLLINLQRQDEALRLFYQTMETYPDDPDLLVATAQAEVSLGYAARAKCHFVRALSIIEKNENFAKLLLIQNQDQIAYHKIFLDFADGMMMWGDFTKAELIYRNAIKNNPCQLELSLKLAWSLTSASRFEEAEEIYQQLLLTYPNQPKVMLAFAHLKYQEKKFDDALEFMQNLLKIDPKNAEYLKQTADILWMQTHYCQAIYFYELFKQDPEHGVDAYIGIGRALIKLGDYEKAQTILSEGLVHYPQNVHLQYYLSLHCIEDITFINSTINTSTSAQNLEKWGLAYIQNGYPEIALSFYQAAVNANPEYFPGMMGLAEILSITYHYDESIKVYQALLDQFPENSKILRAIAQVTSWSKQYLLSIALYDDIISINPHDPVLYKEKARVALWAGEFNLGMATYDELLCRPLNSFSQYLIHQSIYLEKRAKALVWNKQYIHSLDAYQQLLSVSPGNEEALFDYAQSFCTLNLCDCSKEVYDVILHLDPSNSLVRQAVARNALKSHPQLQNNFSYWREIGSGTFSQSQIARYRFDTVYEMPISCRAHLRMIQQEYVENPFYNFRFYPAVGQSLEGDYVFNEYASCFVSATYKNYFNRFKSTFTSHNWLSINVNDYFQLFLSCDNVDEIYNYFSLKQAIQSVNSLAKISRNMTHYWNVSGTYRNYFYNDHNTQNHINFTTEYQFTDIPDIFKLILQADWRNTLHDTINIVVDNTLVDVIHPYWTPIDYYAGSLTLEYRHDLREFVYCEAPQRYIDMKITASIDSVDNPGIQCILEWKHDFERYWGFELKGLLHRSKQWNAEGAWGALYYRF